MRRAFVAILVGATPVAVVHGCDGTGSSTTHAAAGTGGAAPTMLPDAASDHDARDDATGDAASTSDAEPDALTDGAADAVPPCNITYMSIDAGPDAPEACVVQLPCGLPEGVSTQGCALLIAQMPFGCSFEENAGCIADAYSLPESGLLIADCIVCPLGSGRRTGRRRASVASLASTDPEAPLAAHFVRMAREEHASIAAFERLTHELSRHHAPSALVAGAARSARDEARHTRVMDGLARRHGFRVGLASADAPRTRAARPRSRMRTLLALARENAVEGCVREAFGALVLAWQSTHARDPEVRRAVASIAGDELRHAALSLAVARWARWHLDEGQRASLDRSMTSALVQLRRQVSTSALATALAYPPPSVHRALLDGLSRELRVASVLRS